MWSSNGWAAIFSYKTGSKWSTRNSMQINRYIHLCTVHPLVVHQKDEHGRGWKDKRGEGKRETTY